MLECQKQKFLSQYRQVGLVTEYYEGGENQEEYSKPFHEAS